MSTHNLQKCMCLSRNKKNKVYPCKSQFYCIKVGFKGVSIIYVFVIYFSTKTYMVNHKMCLAKALLMSTTTYAFLEK